MIRTIIPGTSLPARMARLLLVASALLLICRCEKVEPERLVMVRTGQVSSVTLTSCSAGGTLLDVGPDGVVEHGFCISTSSTRGGSERYTQRGRKSDKGTYEEIITGLEPGTSYYLWAYASSDDQRVFGDSILFTTLPPEKPVVETGAVTLLTPTSVECICEVHSDGGTEVSERGVCWGSQADPTLEGSYLAVGSGTGQFTATVEGLDPGRSYFLRAYATNSAGISYGNTEEFDTPKEVTLPTVTTGDITNVGPDSAVCSGTILDAGNDTILAKGICWSNVNTTPTLEDEYEVSGTGPESFTITLYGLQHDTEYYIRAYATNEKGTSYGEARSFRTLFACGMDLMDERDGQSYPTTEIGGQCWMARNLDIGVMVDVSAQLTDNSILEKHCYDNSSDYCDQFGGQYTWDEMMQYSEEPSSQGVCPDRWHIPSDQEWKELEAVLGMESSGRDATGFRGVNNEGGKLKSTDPVWDDPNEGATNELGFSALPAGMVWNDGSSSGMGNFSVFWTSIPVDADYAVYRMLSADEPGIGRYEGGYRLNTTSVRCVKN